MAVLLVLLLPVTSEVAKARIVAVPVSNLVELSSAIYVVAQVLATVVEIVPVEEIVWSSDETIAAVVPV